MGTEINRHPGLESLIADFLAHPGGTAAVRMDEVTAGMLMRRRLEEALNAARIRGAEVEVHESRGWFSSSYAIRIKGTDDQVVPTLRYLAALETS
jgi:hypothetical protein